MSGGESRDVEMDARMSQFYGQSAQLGEEFLNPFQSEFLFQTAGIPDADDGFAVDFPIVRLVEITGNDVGGKSSVSCPLKPSDSAPLC